jgi:co-chaperonin GroES (HSP10)
MELNKLRSLNGRILVAPIIEEQKTTAGIITDLGITKKGKLLRGKVVLVDDVSEKIKEMSVLLEKLESLPPEAVTMVTDVFLRLMTSASVRLGEVVYYKNGSQTEIIIGDKAYDRIRTMDLELGTLPDDQGLPDYVPDSERVAKNVQPVSEH